MYSVFDKAGSKDNKQGQRKIIVFEFQIIKDVEISSVTIFIVKLIFFNASRLFTNKMEQIVSKANLPSLYKI